MAYAPMYTTGGKVSKIVVKTGESVYGFNISDDFDREECQNLLQEFWENGQGYSIEFIAKENNKAAQEDRWPLNNKQT